MTTTALTIRPCTKSLSGSVPVAADPDILERALLFAALSSGECRFTIPAPPACLAKALAALASLGTSVDQPEAGVWRIMGNGLGGLREAGAPIDIVGAPVLGQGLLACLSAQPFFSELGPFEAPETLAQDVASLTQRGAAAVAREQNCRLGPTYEKLQGQQVRLRSPSSQAKHLFLVSGLYASGMTIVSEPLVSVDHTERMLDALGLRIDCLGPIVKLVPPDHDSAIGHFDFRAPGSPTFAAYLLAAGSLVPNSHVNVRDVCLNPTRAGCIDAMNALGSAAGISPRRQVLGEPCGDISVKSRRLTGGRVGGELSLRLPHELHALAAVAAHAAGESRFSDLGPCMSASEIAKLTGFLRSFGVEAEGVPEGFWVRGRGGAPLRASRVTTGGDPRLAGLGVLLGLHTDGESVIDDVEALSEFMPKFVGTLRALGADIEVQA